MTVTKKQTATAIALAVGAALTLTGTVAMAHGGKDGGMGGRHGGFMKMEFADIDMDASGLITAEDLQAAAEARFAAADANGDGELSAEEMQAHREAMKAERQAEGGEGKGKGRMDGKRLGWMIEKMISKRDANGNGTLSIDELTPEQAKLDRMIDRFDTDDDNAISQAEFDAAQKEAFMKGRKGGHGKGHGG
ncbi:EF-hand domain-containing protein [Aliiroseovarius sp. 2305UL8-7]|uniref:EF-hand domain-containing protein n=1 Tax=Aliiroseovarius conchicola TaxID=3121637 RepID=UPI003526DA6A